MKHICALADIDIYPPKTGNHIYISTVTGLLPIKYNNMPMTVHIVYDDGTHYVSDPFPMPSLNSGFENKTEVKVFHQAEEPLSGMFGDYYGDPSGEPYPVS